MNWKHTRTVVSARQPVKCEPVAEWCLINGDERAEQDPATFEMPTLVERRRVRTGDLVKLAIELRGLPKKSERLWARVTRVSDTIPRRYTGELESSPILAPLAAGDTIEFGVEHIIDITPPNGREYVTPPPRKGA